MIYSYFSYYKYVSKYVKLLHNIYIYVCMYVSTKKVDLTCPYFWELITLMYMVGVSVHRCISKVKDSEDGASHTIARGVT